MVLSILLSLSGILTCVLCSMSIVQECFEYLDAPVERIAGADVPMPYAANIERMAVPQVISFCLILYFLGSFNH
jgi:pyruvate/2-oxoglutarate/acetoin dehydrogenase E1 component